MSTPVMTIMTSTSFDGDSHNRVVTAGAAAIRYPVKQPYRLSGIKNVLHFTITLFYLKFIMLPFPLQIIRPPDYQARP